MYNLNHPGAKEAARYVRQNEQGNQKERFTMTAFLALFLNYQLRSAAHKLRFFRSPDYKLNLHSHIVLREGAVEISGHGEVPSGGG